MVTSFKNSENCMFLKRLQPQIANFTVSPAPHFYRVHLIDTLFVPELYQNSYLYQKFWNSQQLTSSSQASEYFSTNICDIFLNLESELLVSFFTWSMISFLIWTIEKKLKELSYAVYTFYTVHISRVEWPSWGQLLPRTRASRANSTVISNNNLTFYAL